MSETPITLKEATLEDLPFLQAMIWQALLASPTFTAAHGLDTLEQTEQAYWSRWREHPDPAFVAFDSSGQRLGAILLKPHGKASAIISWRIGMAVETQARGQGIGHRLIEQAILFAREVGAASLTLFVDPTNPRAIALYHHMGFREAGEMHQLLEMCLYLNP